MSQPRETEFAGIAAHGAPPTLFPAPFLNVGGAPCAATAPESCPPHPNAQASGPPGLCPHTEGPHSERLRAFRRMEGGGTFLITKCLEPRRPLLVDDAAVTIAETICHEARCGRMLLAAFVVMPDHWHAVIGVLPEDSLPGRMGVINRWVSQKTRQDLGPADVRWQDGFHDTRIRSSKQFSFAVNYVGSNPVRAQLVESVDDWPHSFLSPSYAEAVTVPWPWWFEYGE